MVKKHKTVLTQPELPSSKTGDEKKTDGVAAGQGRKGANMRRDSRNRPEVVKKRNMPFANPGFTTQDETDLR